jgi:hypothetical protein
MVPKMRSSRLAVVVAAASFALACGGGALSVLHAKGKPTGDGAAELAITNASGSGIDKLYVAKTEAVDKAREGGASPGSDADQALWGDDQLGNAGIADGSTWKALHLSPARYDVLVIAKDHREQLVKHLNLEGGGRYVLEIRDGWAMGRD